MAVGAKHPTLPRSVPLRGHAQVADERATARHRKRRARRVARPRRAVIIDEVPRTTAGRAAPEPVSTGVGNIAWYPRGLQPGRGPISPEPGQDYGIRPSQFRLSAFAFRPCSSALVDKRLIGSSRSHAHAAKRLYRLCRLAAVQYGRRRCQ
jgi:hypothetical protein